VKILWFSKGKRASSDEDYETWIQGGVVPTLNRMDNNGEAYATVLIVDGTRVGDVRVYEDEIARTVISRYGTGGGNVPMIFPIQDGREMKKNQNGLGVGDENAPSYTLDRTGGQAVAYSIREDAKANNFSVTETEVSLALQAHQPSVQSHHAQLFIADDAVAFDEYNNSIADVHHTLRAGTKQSTGVLTSTVRRLTPTECERLQGFPDGWTDEQADSNRYKQMGNAVAVPVVEWIIGRLVNAVELSEHRVEQ
jgi:DNA (cytosine-5)-methyltransferase 1